MSKQSEAKASQGYVVKPVHAVCGNCDHYRRTIKAEEGYFGTYVMEKNRRCGIGGFAVAKTNVCNLHKPKEAAA